MTMQLSRRSFLSVSATLAGGMLIGIGRIAPGEAASTHQLGLFVRIDPTGPITIGARGAEIGQGVKTSLPMLIAEELDVDWNSVVVEQLPFIALTADQPAHFNSLYGNQNAGGSLSVKLSWLELRQAGAKVRRMLREAAAQRWAVPLAAVKTEAGQLIHPRSGKRFPYHEFAAQAATLPVPADDQPLKQPHEYRIIGQRIPVADARGIVTGTEPYGIDARLPGMVYATVVHCPYFGGDLKSLDDRAARAVKGVRDVIKLPKPNVESGLTRYQVAAVAVIADDTWSAFKGRAALKITWEPGPHADRSSELLIERAQQALSGAMQPLRNDGDIELALTSAHRKVEAEYRMPFLSHATLEPQNALLDLRTDSAHLIMSTQSGERAVQLISEMTGIAPANIRVELPRSGGGFGRRSEQDVLAEAVTIAQAVGMPIKLIWPRDEDMRTDWYRPSGIQRMRAGLDAKGALTAWHYRTAATDQRFGREHRFGFPPWITIFDPDAFPAGCVENYRADYAAVDFALPRGFWRGPQPTFCTFALQSFVDEVAHAAGKDPLALRLELLGETDRQLAYRDHGGPHYSTARLRHVLEEAARGIGYGRQLPAGHGIGIAAGFVFGGYTAHAMEVSVEGDAVRIHRCVVAMDVGRMVNALGVEAQAMGGTIDGISAALNQEITLRDGRIEQTNFSDYPLLGMADAPDVDVMLVNSDAEPEGAGEMSTPTVAPALCNAIFAATGLRIRRLPVRAELRRLKA
jgi:isoquinoline 1-oxidoreductase subunit beta